MDENIGEGASIVSRSKDTGETMKKCPKCGFRNQDDAVVCDCGQYISNIPPSTIVPERYYQAIKKKSESTYLCPAILCTIFCCLPLGIVAIYHSAKAKTKMEIADYEGATIEVGKAKTMVLHFLCYWSNMHNLIYYKQNVLKIEGM